jgi:hypothetical protein
MVCQGDPPAQIAWSPGTHVLGKWRIAELPGYAGDYADRVDLACILFRNGRGAFAFGFTPAEL